MDAFNTDFKSPGKDRVSIALAMDVAGLSVRGILVQPEMPMTK